MGTKSGRELSVEKVQAALEEANGSVTTAARLLGCSRPTVYDWIRRHEIVRTIKPTVAS